MAVFFVCRRAVSAGRWRFCRYRTGARFCGFDSCVYGLPDYEAREIREQVLRDEVDLRIAVVGEVFEQYMQALRSAHEAITYDEQVAHIVENGSEFMEVTDSRRLSRTMQSGSGADENSFAEFCGLWNAGIPQLVRSVQAAEFETPLSVYLKLTENRHYAALFESVEGGVNIGRYSFIVCEPDRVWKCEGGKAAQATLRSDNTFGDFAPLAGEALETLRESIREAQLQVTLP